MTLSAKQIIADLKRAEGSELLPKVQLGHRRADDLCLIAAARLEAIQPRPIGEAEEWQEILALWITDGRIRDAKAAIWRGYADRLFYPTHFIPLDALPLPEGE